MLPRILTALVWLATLPFVAAQSDAHTLYPITSAVRDAGVYDIRTGAFTSRAAFASASATQTVIYNNTCTWTGGMTYLGVDPCDDVIDEGRIPSSGPPGTAPDYDIGYWELAYCTAAVTGTVDIDWAVLDTSKKGTGCALGALGYSLNSAVMSFESASAGFPLPGASSIGSVACWIVTFTPNIPTCMNGSLTNQYLFQWIFRCNNDAASSGGVAGGPIVAGEPSIPGGAGTFNIPPGIDPITGISCGHGLDTDDSYWLNVDNSPIGGPPPTTCPSASLGTNCYWFGGYPSNPFASMYFAIGTDGGCTIETGNVQNYCTSKINSLGCTPTISGTGVPKVFSSSPFVISAENLIGNKFGLFFYSTSGLVATPFEGGFLCVKPPIVRLATQISGGSPTTCSGTLSRDFNQWIASNVDPNLVSGQLVGVQCWSRDPASPSTTSLTDGLSFTILP